MTNSLRAMFALSGNKRKSTTQGVDKKTDPSVKKGREMEKVEGPKQRRADLMSFWGEEGTVNSFVERSRAGKFKDIFSRTRVIGAFRDETAVETGGYLIYDMGSIAQIDSERMLWYRVCIEQGRCAYGPFYQFEREGPYRYQVGCIIAGTSDSKVLAKAVLKKALDFAKSTDVSKFEKYDPATKVEIDGKVATVDAHVYTYLFDYDKYKTFGKTEVFEMVKQQSRRFSSRYLGQLSELKGFENESRLLELNKSKFYYFPKYKEVDGKIVGCLVVGEDNAAKAAMIAFPSVLRKNITKQVNEPEM